MKLYDKKTNEEVRIGDVRKTFRNEEVILLNWYAPRSSNSTGRVEVRFTDTEMHDRWLSHMFYPSVIDCVIR